MVILGTPLGLLLAILGLIFDKNKRPATVALILAGGVVLLFLLGALL